ncbi:acyl CoA ligase-like protein [Emericellopsis atlantica]|uniref:Acyl CoA ligase-like protein n=1 Tax=Emericellopsis atlantica TaxID=2614577 RepID=A0A9P7ZSR3_9HYPO|nr:acyl CoA ligase-like protein [Emericellopsis atlantica]KAG9257121.1 acyl CoA ligase-like protein [Emericellopsis atlantica]
MAEMDPELQARLDELQRDLEEGDITEKGYQKRRAQLLSQYNFAPHQQQPEQPQPPRGGLRLHDPDASAYQPSDGHRAAARASMGASQLDSEQGSPVYRPESSYGGASPAFHTSPSATPALLRPGAGPINDRPGISQRDSLFLTAGAGATDAHSRSGTMVSGDYAFNPEQHGAYHDYPPQDYQAAQQYDGRTGTLLDSQGFFSDFAGQQHYDQNQSTDHGEYGGQQRYSLNDPFSPTAAMAPPMLTANDLPGPEALEYQLPLEPREVPFAIHDPHDPNTPMSKFDNMAAILRHRARTTPKVPAYWVLDSKGKETASITWDKLASRAEKVAQVIRDKSSLYRGDRVALVYRDSEIIDFAIALMGCFIAGVVAVPINDLQDYQRLNYILTSTQAHLALTTDNNLKAFQRDITTQKLTWPKGVEWWKTNEFGSYHPKRKDEVPPLTVPDLAYIEFSRAPTGDLRGVVLSHRTIMHQMACLSAMVSTIPRNGQGDTFNPSLRDKNGKLIGGGGGSERMLSYLDPRQGIGMILGVLLNIYGGHTHVWFDNKAVDSPGLYAYLITKYRATVLVADYPGLKRAVYNYLQDPMTTRNFKKGVEPNFQAIKLCLIDTLTVDSEFHEVLADRWLRPLRNARARDAVAPMLCLPEHGGMIISMRDWLGGEQRMGVPLNLELGSEEDSGVEEVDDEKREDTAAPSTGFGSLLVGNTTKKTEQRSNTEVNEVLLDREALKTNEVVVLAVGEEARKKAENDPGAVRVGAFGYPIPDATLAVVDPETGLLASAHSVGEIWVDSPSLSGGFWAQPKNTEAIFHARPYKFEPGEPTPTPVEPEFLRTGLLGTVIQGKIFILGLYEDRIRQKVEWTEHGHEVAEYRHFFVQHIVVSIVKKVSKIFDCSAFDVFVNDEHLPVVVVETSAASTAPATSGGPPRQIDTAMLDSIAERCMEVLMQEHHLRLYCVLITAPNSLPRVIKNGRREIGNMLCRREFDLGNLPCVHTKFGVEHAVLNLPVGVDPIGGIWSQLASDSRAAVLHPADKQYSGIDRREVVIDDRTSTPLNNFSCITDLIQWRVARQPEELSYCTIDGRGREGKGLNWKKFDIRVASVAMYLKNKVKVRPGDHLVLMYTHSEDFVFAVHACINLGAVIIPMAPLDQNRLNEDVPAYLHIISDYKIKAVLVNQDVDHLLRSKPVANHIKQSAQVLKINIPPTYNTTKPPKQSSGLRDLGFTIDPAWIRPGYPVIVWTYWTPDQRRIAVQLGHDTIMGMCKVQKETCQMTSSRPVLGCVRSTTGLGFIHSCLMGIYIGTPTYLLSPVEFAQNPMSLFVTLSRYKIKDTYATPQMLDHAMATMQAKGFTLHELKNLMITADGRPRVDVFQKVRLHFAAAGLDRTAINTIYSHVLNPMVASRSYMCIEPIELWLDMKALRRGLIMPVDPESDPNALLIQDSGMVPVSTQIAIVNPESREHCHEGEYGEIWVDSEACVKSFYGSKDAFDAERFDGRTVDGNPNAQYIRTGDLGFLHNISRPIGPGGALVDMQVLFVIGSIGETFEINGLSHFPLDIEYSVERCHRQIVPGGCAVFQAGGLVVVLVEVSRRSYLASLVPVIVNAILSEHQIIVDIVAFVSKGEFYRSRLGEKQRGKLLGNWVSRKMRTLAQFAIRDVDPSAMGEDAAGATQRHSTMSARSSGGAAGASSLRQVEQAPRIMEQEEFEQQMDRIADMPQAPHPMGMLPDDADKTPTSLQPSRDFEGFFADGGSQGPQQRPHGGREDNHTESRRYDEHGPPPTVGPKPQSRSGDGHVPPQIRLPGVDGREGMDFWGGDDTASRHSWEQDAIMHMNLMGDSNNSRHD